MQRPAIVLAVFAIFAGWEATARGITFELFNGGRIEGKLLNTDEEPRKNYVIETDAGTVTLSAAQVARVAEKSEAEIWYETWLPKMPDDVRGNLKMAEECKTRRLEAQRVYHLEKVVKFDPNHEEARRALGYSKIREQWVKTDVWYRQRGFVRYKHDWALPQQVALDKESDARDKAEKEWNKRIRGWRGLVLKRRDKAQDGLSSLLAIDDPVAVPTLADLLEEKGEPSDLKLVYIQVLSRFPNGASTVALSKRAIQDEDPQVRERALDGLAARQDKLAVRLFIATLKNKNNAVINRAAAALAHMKDPDATLPLIEALTTKHKFLVKNGGGGISPTFGSDASGNQSGGLNMGNKEQVVVRELQNPTVREALIVLNPGINHGYDKIAWKRWYTEQTTPVAVDLRRDL